MLNLALFGSILGRFGVDLGAFSHMGRIAKIVQNLRFFNGFFAILGGGVACMLRHVGAKMAAKSAKMNQHRRKSAPRSMRRA